MPRLPQIQAQLRLHREFVLFALVGTGGFLVDAGILWVVLKYHAGLLFGRMISYLCAASFTWAMNRKFTFADHEAGLMRQWLRFLLVNAIGGSVNYTCYALLVESSEFFRNHPALAVGIGALAGLFFNFALSRRLVFRQKGARQAD